MKLKLALASLFAFFALAGAAQAWTWHLPFYKAANGTAAAVKEACFKDAECTAYASKCVRRTSSRIDCIEVLYYKSELGELACENLVHWGVSYGGYIHLHPTKVHCYWLE